MQGKCKIPFSHLSFAMSVRYGETVETVTDFILGGSKITADGDCSREIKRCLLLGRKVMTLTMDMPAINPADSDIVCTRPLAQVY